MRILNSKYSFEEEYHTIFVSTVSERIEDMSIDRNISEPHPTNESIYPISNQPIQPAVEIPLRRSQ